MITRHRVTTLAAIFVSFAAVGAPGASARPVDVVPASNPSPTAIYSRPDREVVPVSSPVTLSDATGASARRRGRSS